VLSQRRPISPKGTAVKLRPTVRTVPVLKPASEEANQSTALASGFTAGTHSSLGTYRSGRDRRHAHHAASLTKGSIEAISDLWPTWH
jgi:hypothetical protein